MFGTSEESRSEPQQIVILTLAMTGAGFLLVYLFLQYYYIPKVQGQVGQQVALYKALVKELDSEEMKQLRHQAKQQDKDDQQQDLGQIVVEKVSLYGLELSKQTPKRPRDIGKNLIEEGQNIQLESAPLDKIIRFAAAVQEAKNSVRIESFEVRRASRSRTAEAENSWLAELDFVDYKARDSQPPLPRELPAPVSGHPDKAAQLVGNGGSRPLQGVGYSLLADAEPVRDGLLGEDVPVVEVDDLLLPAGQDLDVVEEGLCHQLSLVDTKEVFVINPALFHRGQVRLDVAADPVTGSFEWTEVAEHI